MKGIWMWQPNIEQRGAEKTISCCERAGITDVFFLTKGMAGTTAFHSALAPHASQRDLLREVLDAAHKRGMRVHAWMTSACDEHYKALYPQSGRCHYKRGRDRELISLVDEGYLHYMEQITRELCGRYEVDGLHLDYIRYNHLLYGWAEEDLQRYASEGADTAALSRWVERTFLNETKDENAIFDAFRAGDENVKAFAQTRRKDVKRFAERLLSAARAENGRLILSAALMPEGAYEDTTFADLHYGQSYQDAAKLYDYGLPMAYSQAYGRDSQWVRAVAEGTMKHGLKTLAGVHAYVGGTAATLQADLAALRDSNVQGACLFREGAFLPAFVNGKKVCLYNATCETITSVTAVRNGDKHVLCLELQPGEEQELCLPFAPEMVQAFAGETERCVHVVEE